MTDGTKTNADRRSWTPQDWMALATLITVLVGGSVTAGVAYGKLNSVAEQVVSIQMTVVQTASDLRGEIARQAQRLDAALQTGAVGPGHR